MKRTNIILCLLMNLSAYAGEPSSAQSRFEAGDFTGASAAAQQLLKQDASEAEGHYWLGRIALKSGDLETAADELEEAVDAAPDNAEYLTRFAQVSCSLAGSPDTGMLRKPGLAGDCRESFLHATEVDPKSLTAWKGLFEFYRQAPGIAGGGIDKAEALVGKIAALDPAEGELALANLAAQQEKLPLAREHIAKAALLNPASAGEYRFQEALMLMQAKDFVGAHALLKQLRGDSPDDAQIQYQFGRIAVLAEQPAWYADAEQSFLAYLARTDLSGDHTDKAWAAFRLGQLYELMGKPDLAKARFQWAAGQKPDDRLKGELKKKATKV